MFSTGLHGVANSVLKTEQKSAENCSKLCRKMGRVGFFGAKNRGVQQFDDMAVQVLYYQRPFSAMVDNCGSSKAKRS